jgi:hypothetical protein
MHAVLSISLMLSIPNQESVLISGCQLAHATDSERTCAALKTDG